MSDVTPLIAGNWKMYKTVSEAEAFIAALLPRVSSVQGVDVAICPTFLALQAMVDSTRGSRVQVYAQNMHQAAEGAFTGEVSAPMLVEVGVHGVVLGHSERREMFGETDRALQLKVPAREEAGRTHQDQRAGRLQSVNGCPRHRPIPEGAKALAPCSRAHMRLPFDHPGRATG